VSLLALTFVRLVCPLHFPSLIALAAQTAGAKRHAVKSAQDHTGTKHHGCATDRRRQKRGKYTSPSPARQSSGPRQNHGPIHFLSNASSQRGRARSAASAPTLNLPRPKRTQVPVDTVDNTPRCLSPVKSPLCQLWNRPRVRPPPAHDTDASPSRASLISTRCAASNLAQYPSIAARRRSIPPPPATSWTSSRDQTGAETAGYPLLFRPYSSFTRHRIPPRPPWLPASTGLVASILVRSGGRKTKASRAARENHFPQLQQKRWCMRPSASRFLHVFNRCGLTCA
jgi:hypothetical protein